VSMLEGQLGILSGMIGAFAADGIVPGPLGTAYGALLPYQTFRTKTRELALAVEMGADAADIGKTIHPHPTLSESVGMAAELFEGVCTDLPPQKKK